jgi:hypothetical protein
VGRPVPVRAPTNTRLRTPVATRAARSRTDPPQAEHARQPRRFHCAPHALHPKSQFFSQSFESNLPTSLTHILPSTRGCTPWRPAAVMGTPGRENAQVSRREAQHLPPPPDFQGSSRAHRTVQSIEHTALPAARTVSPLNAIPRCRLYATLARNIAKAVKERRKLPPGLSPTSPSLLALPPHDAP